MRKSQTYGKAHQYRRKKPIFRSRLLWFIILFFIILTAAFYFLFFSKTFQIEKIVITNQKRVPKEDIMRVAERGLENKLLFFKTKSVFLVNLKELEKDILNNFSQISKVEIKRNFPDSLQIIVIERPGLANWCRKDDCYLLDNEGIIFEKSSLRKDLITIRDEREIESFNIGEKAIGGDYPEKMLEIKKRLDGEFKIIVKEFVVLPDRLTVKTSEDWEIYFDPQKDLDWQLTKLGAVLEEKIPPEKRGDLEYIELRFGNFAPYKYR